KSMSYLASGRPFTFIWFIAAVGAVLIILALWPQRQRERSTPRLPLLIIGAILALVGTAPLWSRASDATQIPALLLYWIGLVLLIAAFVWLIILSLLRARRKIILPLIAVLIGCILAFFICRSAVRSWPDVVD